MKNLKHLLTLALTLALLIPGPALAGEVSDPYADLWPRIDGSTATIPLTEAAAAFFGGAPAVEQIRHNTTSSAYENLLSGQADVIFVTYPAPSDFIWLEHEEGGLWEQIGYVSDYLADPETAGVLEITPVVRDALVFITDAENPVAGLTQEQLRAIYTGEITNWNQVGGEDLTLIPYQRNNRSGSQTLFLELLMGDVPPMEAPVEWVPGQMALLVSQVAAFRTGERALGYSVYYYVQNMYGAEALRLLAVDGVEPTARSIAAGDYPLSTYYYAVLRADLPQDAPARQLVEWMLSGEGQRLAQQAGYVPLAPMEQEEQP